MHEDERHIDIKKKLKNLPKVQASDGFVNSLQRKINLVEAEKSSSSIHKKYVDNIEKGFFAKILGSRKNPWLIPALGFTVVLFFIFTVVYINVKQNNLDISEDQTKEDKSAITLKTDEIETSKESSEDVEVGEKESSGKEIAEDISTEGTDDLRAPDGYTRGFTERKVLRKETSKISDKDEFTDGLIIEKQETYFTKTEEKSEEETGVEKEEPKVLETQKIEKKVAPMVRSKEEKSEKTSDRKEKKADIKKGKEEIERSIKGLNEIDQSDLERLREEVIND